MSVIDKVAPIKERWVKKKKKKKISQEWFDKEIVDVCNTARYKVRKMIFNKKISFFEK